MLFLGFVFLLIIYLQIIYGLNGYIFDGKLTPIIMEYNIDTTKSVDTIKDEIKRILKDNNISGYGFSFWYLSYNGVNNQFIDIENPIPLNDENDETILIVYQNMDMILFHQALSALNSVRSIKRYNGYYFGEISKVENELIPNGVGIMKGNNGGIYTGEFVNGIKQGHGVFRWKDGSSHKGRWNDDKRNGYGELISMDDSIYSGNWVADKKNGHGIFKYKSGNEYNGEWESDKREGFGFFREKVDDYWLPIIGNWKYNVFNGIGKIITPNGKYVGSCYYQKRHGNGVKVYNNGDKYIGQWKNGKKHGYGIYIWVDGRQYIGEWENDQQKGKGRITKIDGTIRYGMW